MESLSQALCQSGFYREVEPRIGSHDGGSGKSEICKADQQAGNSGRSW